MRQAPVSILKAQLSQYLAAVKAGEEVVVTERGRPVARLVPVGEAHAPEGRVAMLVREGRIRPPTGPLSLRPVEALPKDPHGRVLEALLEERAEGR
jgi:prevent-host-death family protein